MARSVAYSLSNDGRFRPVRVAYRTSESNPLSKEHAFSRQRKYVRQTNGISDQARSLPVRTDSNAHGASASPHACLRYTSGAMAGADKGGAKRVVVS